MTRLINFAMCAAVSAASLVDTLSSVVFRHAGRVNANDSFPELLLCSGFTEGSSEWTLWGYRPYSYAAAAVSNETAPPRPPMGVRSALALGGIGAGSIELRADGSFHDLMIQGQNTALALNAVQSARIPDIPNAFLAVSAQLGAGERFSAAVRTAPPAGVQGVQALEYAAAWPFSRLRVLDDRLCGSACSMDVYAYSPLVPFNSTISGAPLIAFVLLVNNSQNALPVNVSFAASMPLGEDAGVTRPLAADTRNQTLARFTAPSSQACIDACAATDGCVWWTYSGNTSVPPTPPITMPNSDCPGNDLPDSTRKAVATLEDCTALCGAVPMCAGVVFDQIPSEQGAQCNNANSSLWCCLPKALCSDFTQKDGDTAWAAGSPGVPAQMCTLFRLAPPVQQFMSDSSSSGVLTWWQGDGAALRGVRNASFDSDPAALNADPAAAVGDYTLAALDADATVSYGAFGSVQDVWSAFAAGAFPHSAAQPLTAAAAAHGAVASSVVVPPGATRTVTLLFSWYHAPKLYVGQDLGNQYSQVWPSSAAVAAEVASSLDNITVAAAAVGAAFNDASLPDAFVDMMLNGLTFLARMTVWVASDASGNLLPGGRWRTFEAFSNCDLDPVHVVEYHLLPILQFWPDLVANVLETGWASQQLQGGMVQEFLGNFAGPNGRITGQMDISAGGRVMGDVTSVFILLAAGVVQQTSDIKFLARLYPAVQRAVQWQIAQAASTGFPGYLQTTYDYLGLSGYPYVPYNGFLHMAAMRAFAQLAALVGDNSTIVQQAAASDAACLSTMQAQLWTGDSWRGYQTVNGDAPNGTMAGTLHGQVWAATLGLGDLAPPELLLAHVLREVAQGCAYNASCWLGQMAFPSYGASWAADMSPSMSMDAAAAWVALRGIDVLGQAPAAAVATLYQQQLADLFNVHDLHVGPAGLSTYINGSSCVAGVDGINLSSTALVGTPFVNSHYARHMQGWHVFPAASGMRWNAHARAMSFRVTSTSPAVTLPWFMHGAFGRLHVWSDRAALTVVFGALHNVTVSLEAAVGGAALRCAWSADAISTLDTASATCVRGVDTL